MRYDRNGNGRTVSSDADVYAAAFPTGGAVCHGCIGYELVRSLDFRDAGTFASGKVNLAWTGGLGWEPISSSRENSGNFGNFGKYIFDGNGHTISNLYISHQGDHIGLFGQSGGIIREIGLVDVKVSGTGSVGGLVGENYGIIIASYVTGVGVVTGQGNAGGLVGTNGAYRKTGAVISASYSTADVTSNYEAGGLLGDEAGGLAGSNDGLIIASYASGDVTGGFENASGAVWNGATVDARRSANPAATGGLVGRQFGRNYIVASYWDTQTSGRATGVGKGDDPGAEGKTTAELQAPTGYTGIYAGWNVDLDNADGDDDPATGPDDWWDFRSGSQYPVLKLDPDSRPSANGTYDTDGDGLIEVSTLEQLDVIRWSKDSPGEAVGGWGNNRSAAAAFPTGGEVCNVCYGYELVRSLDFQDAGSYASGEVNTAWIRGEGWDPEDFDGTLYGNGHTISNLYINRPDKSNVGFFWRSRGNSPQYRVDRCRRDRQQRCRRAGRNERWDMVRL